MKFEKYVTEKQKSFEDMSLAELKKYFKEWYYPEIKRLPKQLLKGKSGYIEILQSLEGEYPENKI